MTKLIAAVVAVSFLATGIAIAAEPNDNVKFSIEKWRKPGSNNIGTADITIDNANDFAVKDVRIQCHYVVKTGGKKIETDQTIAVTVKPKTKKTFKKTKFPFIDEATAEGSCKLVSASKA